MNEAEAGYPGAMKHLSPKDLGTDPPAGDEDDELWHEAKAALGLFGAVLLLVFVISLAGRL